MCLLHEHKRVKFINSSHEEGDEEDEGIMVKTKHKISVHE